VVLRGGSSAGKTRAAYQAVTGLLSDWRLDYPLDPAAVAARLETGIPARTVLCGTRPRSAGVLAGRRAAEFR
jgi:hypothetical protein